MQSSNWWAGVVMKVFMKKTTQPITKKPITINSKQMNFRYSTENIPLKINSLILGVMGLVSFWHRRSMYIQHPGVPCLASAHTGYANKYRKVGRCSHMSRRVRRTHPTSWPEGLLCWGSSEVEDENCLAFWREPDCTICHSV